MNPRTNSRTKAKLLRTWRAIQSWRVQHFFPCRVHSLIAYSSSRMSSFPINYRRINSFPSCPSLRPAASKWGWIIREYYGVARKFAVIESSLPIVWNSSGYRMPRSARDAGAVMECVGRVGGEVVFLLHYEPRHRIGSDRKIIEYPIL